MPRHNHDTVQVTDDVVRRRDRGTPSVPLHLDGNIDTNDLDEAVWGSSPDFTGKELESTCQSYTIDRKCKAFNITTNRKRSLLLLVEVPESTVNNTSNGAPCLGPHRHQAAEDGVGVALGRGDEDDGAFRD